MSAGHIFLSYRSLEADFALKLAADLKNAGVNLWMDRLDGIRGGDDWRRSIQQALNNCAGLIPVLSPDYVTSDYCQNELARADALKRAIFPVLLRPVTAEDWPIAIQRLQHMDFRDWRDEQVYQQRLSELLNVLPDAQKGMVPDTETRYLTTLIAELESRKGVLEYVELSAQAEAPRPAEATRPEPHREDEWAAGFSMLIDKKSDSVGTGRALSAPSLDTPTEKLIFNSIAEAVAKFPRFVLIGEPGAGKTTTIRRLALEAARQRLENPRTAPLPLMLYLPQWGDEPTPLDFVRKHWPFTNDPAGLLANGDVLLYLDGLNEMGAAGVEKAKKLREWFRSPDAPKHLIVTCRAGDYAGELMLDGLATVLAGELHEAQIREFVTRYLGEKANGFLARVMPDDGRLQKDVRGLFRLAKNPYLLAALLFVYDNAPDGDLPRNNGTLFRALARASWERERFKQNVGWIPFDEIEPTFAKLAYWMIENGLPIDIPYKYALKHIGSEQLIKLGIDANYLLHNGEQIRFYHQLTQEYFAAVHLTEIGIHGRVKPRSYGRYFRSTVGIWDQVIVSVCGITPDADRILRDIIPIDPFLAATCVASGISSTGETRRLLVDELTNIFRTSSQALPREAAVKSLGEMQDTLALPSLFEALRDTRSTLSWLAADGLEIIGKPAVGGLIEALSSDHFTRSVAAQTLGKIGDPIAIPALINVLELDREVEAAIALGRIGTEAPVSALINAARITANNQLHSKAIDALANIGSLAIPKLIVELDDPDVFFRYSIITILGDIADEAATYGLIQKLSDYEKPFKHLDERICDIAAEALTRIGTPEALAAVEQWQAEEAHRGGE